MKKIKNILKKLKTSDKIKAIVIFISALLVSGMEPGYSDSIGLAIVFFLSLAVYFYMADFRVKK